MWAPDARNGLVMTGYSVEGTLARVSQHSPTFTFVRFPDVVYTQPIHDVFPHPFLREFKHLVQSQGMNLAHLLYCVVLGTPERT